MGTTEERFGTFRFNPFRMLCNLEGTSAFMGTMAVSRLRANAKVCLTAQHVQLQRYLGLPELLSAHVDSILFHFGCARYSSPSFLHRKEPPLAFHLHFCSQILASIFLEIFANLQIFIFISDMISL